MVRPANPYSGQRFDIQSADLRGQPIGTATGEALRGIGQIFMAGADGVEKLFARQAVHAAKEAGQRSGAGETTYDQFGTAIPTFTKKPGAGLVDEAYNRAGLAIYGDRLSAHIKEKALDLTMRYKDDPDGLKSAYEAWFSGVRETVPVEFRGDLEKQGVSIFAPLYLHNVRQQEKRIARERRAAVAAAAATESRFLFSLGMIAAGSAHDIRPDRPDFMAVVREGFSPEKSGLVWTAPPAWGGASTTNTAAAAAGGRALATMAQGPDRARAMATAPGFIDGKPDEVALRRISGNLGSYTFGYFTRSSYEAQNAMLKNLLAGRLLLAVPGADGKGVVTVDASALLDEEMRKSLVDRMSETLNKMHTLDERERAFLERSGKDAVSGFMRRLAITGDRQVLSWIENDPRATIEDIEKARKIYRAWDATTDRETYGRLLDLARRGALPPSDLWSDEVYNRISRVDRAEIDKMRARAVDWEKHDRYRTAKTMIEQRVSETFGGNAVVVLGAKEGDARREAAARLMAGLGKRMEAETRRGALIDRTSKSDLPVEERRTERGAVRVFDPLAWVTSKIDRAKTEIHVKAEAELKEIARSEKEIRAAMEKAAKERNRREAHTLGERMAALAKRKRELRDQRRRDWREFLESED